MAKPATEDNSASFRRAFLHGISGCFAGMISAATFFPLDLVKTIQQNKEIGKSKLLPTAAKVVRHGGFRSLYSGLSVNLYGSGSAWGLYFFGYNFLQDCIRDYKGGPGLTSSDHFLAANVTGGTVCVVTNPIWVVKTRMQIQKTANIEPVYRNLWDGLYKLATKEKLYGLTRGLGPNLLNVVHGSIHIATYERLRRLAAQHFPSDSPFDPRQVELSSAQTMICAAAAKTFALITTYPLQVFRTRQHRVPRHQAPQYDGVLRMARTILANEGFSGLYKGVQTASLREIPATCVTFLVYESIKAKLLPLL